MSLEFIFLFEATQAFLAQKYGIRGYAYILASVLPIRLRGPSIAAEKSSRSVLAFLVSLCENRKRKVCARKMFRLISQEWGICAIRTFVVRGDCVGKCNSLHHQGATLYHQRDLEHDRTMEIVCRTRHLMISNRTGAVHFAFPYNREQMIHMNSIYQY